jgi:hypothetical protein
MEQCFYGNGFGWGYPWLDMGDLDTGILFGGLVDLAMEAGWNNLTTITFMVGRI